MCENIDGGAKRNDECLDRILSAYRLLKPAAREMLAGQAEGILKLQRSKENPNHEY